jgi:membrane associated rhomboid family serine protease
VGRGTSAPTFTIPGLTPGVKRLIIINVAIYVVFVLLMRTPLAPWLLALMLSPADTFSGQLWQPLTYMFLHEPASPGHLLMNVLMLFFFGRNVEQLAGTKKLYQIYVLSGLGGAALTLLLGLVSLGMPLGWLGTFWTSVHLGASGAVFGLILYWGAVQWNDTANFFLLGSMQVKTFIYIIIGIEVLGVIALSHDTSYTSHFGGMIAGFLLGRYGVPKLAVPNLKKMRANAKHRQTAQRLSRFKVIDGGGENPGSSDDTVGRPIWRQPDDDDDPTVH